MLHESMDLIKRAAAEVPDEALSVLNTFDSKFYKLCKEIAAEEQRISLGQERQQEKKEQESKSIYHDDISGAF